MSFWGRLIGRWNCNEDGHKEPSRTIRDSAIGQLMIVGLCPECKEVVGACLIGLDPMEWTELKDPNSDLGIRLRKKLTP